MGRVLMTKWSSVFDLEIVREIAKGFDGYSK
jgi:hypothetical protein